MTNYEKIINYDKEEMLDFLCEFLTDFDRSYRDDIEKWLVKDEEE